MDEGRVLDLCQHGTDICAYPDTVRFTEGSALTEIKHGPDQKNEAMAQSSGEAPVPALLHPSPAPAPKRRLWLWAAGGVLGVALAALAFTQLWMTQPTPVIVEIATLAPVTRVLAVNGRIAAVHSVDVASVVTGSLVLLAVAEGDRVDADQILARVDPSAQAAALRQAQAALDGARVAQAQATEAYNRALALGDNVSVSLLETSAHTVQSAENQIALQTAILDQAKVILETYTTRAPVAGSILTLNVDQGQVVGPSTPILTISDLSDLVVEADIDEAYAAQIAMNQPAVLQLAGEAQNRGGHVSFVSTRVDASTGGLAIKIAFEEPVAAAIGLTVTANIIVDQRDAALTVPRAAMVSDADGTGIYVVTNDVANFQPLAVEDWPAARLLVTEGLAPGDVIIMDATGITSGQAVAVENP